MTWSTCCRVKGLFAPVSEPRLMVKLDWWQRCRYHPCIKGHVGQCRGQVGFRRAVGGNSWVFWWRGRDVLWPHPCRHDEQR